MADESPFKKICPPSNVHTPYETSVDVGHLGHVDDLHDVARYLFLNENLATSPDTLVPEATTLQQLSATERTLYTQLRTLHNNVVSHYHRYLTEKAKLKNKLLITVPKESELSS
ncbi:hypothetical protein V8E54_014257 [Elaphomyces granulatus]